MKLSKDVFDALKRLAVGYDEYVISEEYLPKNEMEGREEVSGSFKETIMKTNEKQKRAKKSLPKTRTIIVEDVSDITDWGEGETALTCSKRKIDKKHHSPEVAAIKMMLELEKVEEESDLERLANEIKMLTSSELIALRRELLTKDPTEDLD